MQLFDPCEQAIIITALVDRVRTRDYGFGDQVRFQSIMDALTDIYKNFQMVGKQSPTFQT